MLGGKRVLELGAGTGLIGLAAAHVCVPAELVLTDVESHLALLAANARANAPAGCRCLVEPYDWFSVEEIQTGRRPLPGSTGKCFDVILGGDLAYNPLLYKPLVAAIDAASDQHTIIFLGVSNRADTRCYIPLGIGPRGSALIIFFFLRLPEVTPPWDSGSFSTQPDSATGDCPIGSLKGKANLGAYQTLGSSL